MAALLAWRHEQAPHPADGKHAGDDEPYSDVRMHAWACIARRAHMTCTQTLTFMTFFIWFYTHDVLH